MVWIRMMRLMRVRRTTEAGWADVIWLEYQNGTDPNNADTRCSDTYTDGEEVAEGSDPTDDQSTPPLPLGAA